MSHPAAPSAPLALLIGTYTEQLPHVHGTAEGVLGADFDPATGALGPVRLLAAAHNPSWVAPGADGTAVYAVDERDDGGSVVAFARDRETGALTPLGSRSSGGSAPCHLLVHPDGRFVIAANYGSGTVTVLPRGADGTLGEPVSGVRHTGSGPDPDRQEGPHCHMAALDPVTGLVLVVDLGLDAVAAYRLDPAGLLTPAPDAAVALAPGSGPRHLAFSPDGRLLYVVAELANTVTVLARDAEEPTAFRVLASHPTRPEGRPGTSSAAAIRVSADGRLVFASNRGDDTVAVFRAEPDGGLALAATVPVRGRGPRDLLLSPDGRFLLAACQDEGGVQVFEVDEEAATLTHRHAADVPTPVCLAFV